MKDLWLKIGCFLAGYKYSIIRESSETSARTVTKYLSAMLIISIIWGFIGFNFSRRYLHTDLLGSSIVSLVMVVIIIQIERQIILSSGKNRMVVLFRTLIGIVMALIGSVIMDQIMFREDVEKQKITNIQEEVNVVLPQKTKELDMQIAQLDSAVNIKETERSAIIDEITRRPFVKSTTTETKHIPLQVNGTNGERRDTVVRRTDYTLTDVSNPKAELLPDIEKQISTLRDQKSAKENSKINIRQELETELRSKTGFLDELKVLFTILLTSRIALAVWILFFAFFLTIELFVLVNKFGERENDYDRIIAHQMDVRLKLLDKLTDR
jgi:cell division protein FtsB